MRKIFSGHRNCKKITCNLALSFCRHATRLSLERQPSIPAAHPRRLTTKIRRQLFQLISLQFLIALLLVLGVAAAPISATAQSATVPLEEAETAMRRGLDWLVGEIARPQFGSVGGEWTVLTLARGHHPVPAGYFERYIVHIGDHLDALTETTDPNSTLMHFDNAPTGNWVYNPATGRREVRMGNQVQSTENVRLAIALTSLGLDASAFVSPRSGHTYDLIARLGNRHNATSDLMLGELQGLNGPIWSLIALNSRGWDRPYVPSDRAWVGGTTAANPITVDERVNWILDTQLPNGGWNLFHHNPSATPDSTVIADSDMTANAIQVLAPYYYRPEVRAAVARGLDELSRIQLPNGGWDAWGADNVQSTAWVVVALTDIGVDPQRDPRFIKPGGNPISSILRFQTPATGGFTHPHADAGGTDNHMATDQATYALVSYWRFRNGMNQLYNMSDAFGQFNWAGTDWGAFTDSLDFGLPGKHPSIGAVPVTSPGISFGDVQNHANRAAVEALASRGIITGNDGAFNPDATMTRAEFSAIITRGLGLPVRAPDTILEDIAPTAWFANAVRTAFYFDIVRGIVTPLAVTFNPGGTITRQEAAVMVARAARLSGMDTALTDVEIMNIMTMFGDYRAAANWAWEALAFCFLEGILDDYEFYMEPLAAITRGEIAGMVYQLLARANLLH